MLKPFSPSCERNQDAILQVLRQQFAGCTHALEIGSGTGQHAVHFARALPELVWQTSEMPERLSGIRLWLAEARLPNTPDPVVCDINGSAPQGKFDAIFSANTLHIMSWPEVERLFAVLPQVMSRHAVVV